MRGSVPLVPGKAALVLSPEGPLVEQLAGDLLPDATESQKIATGFHRNTTINQEGGIDARTQRP